MPETSVKEKKRGLGKAAGFLLVFCVLAIAAILAFFYFRTHGPLQPGPTAEPAPSSAPTPETTPTPPPADLEPPVIEGPNDMTVAVGMTPSYRSGVTAVDAVDGKVKLEIDASAVNLSQPGKYPVIYRAKDKSDNQAEITVILTVVEVSGVNDDDPTADVSGEEDVQINLPPIGEVTDEMVNQEADQILSKILSPSMSQFDQARAIYNYVHTHVKYVGSSDKSSWLMGAYVGFTRRRGDCYNYFACAKALLTRAGIPNVDLERVGGNTDHYWQLVDVGSGWYHFDACPHPDSYPLHSFLLDEMAVRAYTEKCTPIRTNYYVYDYANCPVIPVGFPEDELPQESELPGEGEFSPEGELPPEEVLLPPGVFASAPPVEIQEPSPEPIESIGTEEPAPQLSPEPMSAVTEEPHPTEEQTPEAAEPSPAPEIDPSASDIPAEFEAPGKEETP